eukprot:g2503.t1
MRLLLQLAVVAAFIVLCSERGVRAQYADLTQWQQYGPAGAGSWEVTQDKDTVEQKINGEPTYFVSPFDFIDAEVTGTFETSDNDDDFMGFVIGFDGDYSPVTSDPRTYIWFSWRAKDQKHEGATAKRGFRLNFVEGLSSAMPWGDDQIPAGKGTEFHNSQPGYDRNVRYTFRCKYETTRIQIFVKGGTNTFKTEKLIFDVKHTEVAAGAGAGKQCKQGKTGFRQGRFGFVNYSQQSVVYGHFKALGTPQKPILKDDIFFFKAQSGVRVSGNLLKNDINRVLSSDLTVASTTPTFAWGTGTLQSDGSFSFVSGSASTAPTKNILMPYTANSAPTTGTANVHLLPLKPTVSEVCEAPGTRSSMLCSTGATLDGDLKGKAEFVYTFSVDGLKLSPTNVAKLLPNKFQTGSEISCSVSVRLVGEGSSASCEAGVSLFGSAVSSPKLKATVPKDCVLNAWGKWSECNAARSRSRTRTVKTAAKNCGSQCDAKRSETQNCIDCVVSTWGTWSACSSDLKRSKKRDITTAPSNGGSACPNLEAEQKCVDCKVGEWGPWQNCAFGVKEQYRVRATLQFSENGGKECPPLKDARPCPWAEQVCYPSCQKSENAEAEHATLKPVMYIVEDGGPCGQIGDRIPRQCNGTSGLVHQFDKLVTADALGYVQPAGISIVIFIDELGFSSFSFVVGPYKGDGSTDVVLDVELEGEARILAEKLLTGSNVKCTSRPAASGGGSEACSKWRVTVSTRELSGGQGISIGEVPIDACITLRLVESSFSTNVLMLAGEENAVSPLPIDIEIMRKGLRVCAKTDCGSENCGAKRQEADRSTASITLAFPDHDTIQEPNFGPSLISELAKTLGVDPSSIRISSTNGTSGSVTITVKDGTAGMTKEQIAASTIAAIQGAGAGDSVLGKANANSVVVEVAQHDDGTGSGDGTDPFVGNGDGDKGPNAGNPKDAPGANSRTSAAKSSADGDTFLSGTNILIIAAGSGGAILLFILIGIIVRKKGRGKKGSEVPKLGKELEFSHINSLSIHNQNQWMTGADSSSDWELTADAEGNPYYFNRASGETKWA